MKKEFKKSDSKGRESLWEWEEILITQHLLNIGKLLLRTRDRGCQNRCGRRKLTKAIVDRADKR